MKTRSILLLACLAFGLFPAPYAMAERAPIAIVAAENFYGDIAAQIGGPHVRVTNILDNPDVDPHLFEASPSVARALATARIVIYSGIGYDPWITKLIGASRDPERRTIDVAALAGKKIGDNPHVWYDFAAIRSLAKRLTVDLSRLDPGHQTAYQAGFVRFRRSLQPLETQVAALRVHFGGDAVAATEPVFGYMLDALGLKSRDQSFQRAVMNGTEPSAADVAGFERDLKTHRVRILIFNRQTINPLAKHMVAIAKNVHVPVVGVTETMPKGQSYQTWVKSELDAVGKALQK